MKLSFTKMQGCANDYIYLDCRESGVPENIAALSEKLSRRHFSIGADGIICICAAQSAGADGMMRIFNADGSEGRMCGNGIRCVAEWLYTHGISKETLAIDTLSGLKTLKMCVGYEKPDGTILKDFPPALEELADCKPIYEEFEGFSEDISSCKTFDELPEACKKYIARLEEVCGCKVVMVGNGPDRSQILER